MHVHKFPYITSSSSAIRAYNEINSAVPPIISVLVARCEQWAPAKVRTAALFFGVQMSGRGRSAAGRVLQEELEAKLEKSGELERLKSLLQERLEECGWKEVSARRRRNFCGIYF